MNYSRFLTRLSKNRKPSTIREMTNILVNASPDLVFLGGGLPNPDMFPFQEGNIKLRDGTEIHLDSQLMRAALQYGPTQGYPPLVAQLKSLVHRFHSPPRWDDTDLVITPGSQDGLCKVLEMMLSPGDFVIVQEPCYTGTLAILGPYELQYIPVGGDSHGMIPELLSNALERWKPEDVANKVEGIPKVLYLNTNGANPSGVSIEAGRRLEIYKIAQKYNLIILEDDPYYFVQFDDMKNFAPSFLNLDTDGRVVRFDSFSKVMSSGIRLGFTTGPKEIIRPLTLHMQASILHASSLSQVLVSKLLSQWGDDGFDKHVKSIQEFYRQRRDLMLSAAEKHLSDLCEWSVPTGGMFLWFKVHGLEDTWDMIMKKGLEKNVILVPGKAFMTDQTKPCCFMRAAFSLATPEKIDLGMKYLAELIREEIEQNAKKN